MKRSHQNPRNGDDSPKRSDGGECAEGSESHLSQKVLSWRNTTCAMVNVVGVMERMDEQLLPAASSYVACAFKIGPSVLGSITFWRAVVQGLASPLGGFAGHHLDRVVVIAFGCFIWGLCTILFSLSPNIHVGRLVLSFNGVGIGLIIPNAQSLVADYYPAQQRGSAFGMFQLTGALGGMCGALYATNIGMMTVWGMAGWRFAFLSVACASWCAGLALLCLGHDPRLTYKKRKWSVVRAHRSESTDGNRAEAEPLLAVHSTTCGGGAEKQAHSHQPPLERVDSKMVRVHSEGSVVSSTEGDKKSLKPRQHKDSMWPKLGAMLRTPTFLIIIFQGILGSMPWNGMVFFTLYFQLLGMGNMFSSFLTSLLLAGTAVGGLLGGWIGDQAAVRYPLTGRIMVTQLSVASGVPMSILLVWGLPKNSDPATMVVYSILMFLFGSIISWAAPACNNPIFAEIVPEDMRNFVYSFDRSLEGALSAMSAWLVGWTAENWFGFKGEATAGCDGADKGSGIDLAKANSLGDAMLMFMVLPWAACAVIYAGLYWTYPADKARVAEAAARNQPGLPCFGAPTKVS